MVQDLFGDTEHTGCFRWSWWLFFDQNQRPPHCHGKALRGVCNFAVADLPVLWTENGAGGAKEKTIEQEIEALDESLLSDDSGDEFDSMVN